MDRSHVTSGAVRQATDRRRLLGSDNNPLQAGAGADRARDVSLDVRAVPGAVVDQNATKELEPTQPVAVVTGLAYLEVVVKGSLRAKPSVIDKVPSHVYITPF
jgi:hypothetical protein